MDDIENESTDYACPRCNAMGYTEVLACPGGEIRYPKCPLCEGRGHIGFTVKHRFFRGRTIRAARVNRRESQAEAAKRLGLDVVTYSKMEQGLIDNTQLVF